MRPLFLFFILLVCVVGFFYYNPPKSIRSDGQPATVSQWVGAITAPSQPVWTAPVNPQYPSEWTTTDGQKFSKVKVMSMAPDAVTIMHSYGVSVVDLAVLPPELQRTFNYNRNSAQYGELNRENGEMTNSAALLREQLEGLVAQIGDTSGVYIDSHYEHERLIPYRAQLAQLNQEIQGYIATLNASEQKVKSDRAALDRSDPQAVASYNAELKQYNVYYEWVGQQLIDYKTQVLNFNNELKMRGTLKQ